VKRSDPGLARISVAEWLDAAHLSATARPYVDSLIRLATYCGDFSTLSADAAVGQLLGTSRGVLYLHGGWQRLVDQVRSSLNVAKVTILPSVSVRSISAVERGWAVRDADQTVCTAASVVLAVGTPRTAATLLGGASDELAVTAERAAPVDAACLDLGLRSWPAGGKRLVLGTSEPLYFSVHTPAAKLAPAGGALVHTMRYEPGTAETDPIGSLESLMDLACEGWRSVEVERQIGKRRIVMGDRPQPGRGLRGRIGVTLTDAAGIYLAGDWVGPAGLLSDAAISSGRAAGIAAAHSTTRDR
jgi:phytoene dehydrogenase-like protein